MTVNRRRVSRGDVTHRKRRANLREGAREPVGVLAASRVDPEQREALRRDVVLDRRAVVQP